MRTSRPHLPSVIAVLALLAAPSLEAAEPPAAGSRLCIALSGGGARGLAHVGVLQAFEERAIPIQCVAGTSAGALVGSLHAAGYSAKQMDDLVRSVEWQRVFSGQPERALVPMALRLGDTPPIGRLALRGLRVRLPPARDSDYRVNRLLFRLLAPQSFEAAGSFDALRVPFRAVATDLESGERVVLDRGSLVRAVRASLSTPVDLVPMRVDGRLLVDGGLVDNFPVGVARALDASLVVGVDARSPALRPQPSDSFVETTAVVVDLLLRARHAQPAELPDVEIDLGPALAGLGDRDYAQHARILEIGHRVGEEGAERVRARLREGGLAAPPVVAPTGARLEGSLVRKVAVHGRERVREGVIRRAFTLEEGRPFTMDAALQGLDTLYATLLFESVWLDVAPAPQGGVLVTVDVREEPRLGLEIGGGYDEGDKARGFLRVRNRNLLGRGERSDTILLASESEVGLHTAFTAERPRGLPVGVFVRGHRVRETPRFFAAREALGRAEFDRLGLAAGLQQRLGPAALVRVGLSLATVRVRERPGVPLFARRDRLRTLLAEAAWDVLDDPVLPARGAAATVTAERSLPRLHATHEYWRVVGRARAAMSPHPRLVLRADVLAGVSGQDLPIYERVRIGGPLWMPGFHRDELWGAQALGGSVTAAVGVYRDLRVLARLGAGQAWEARSSVSLGALERGFGFGLELPTRAGPIVVDWSRTGAGTSRVHVALGFPWTHASTR